MHTVIVGGGFAGVKAALEISKRQLGKVTLISDQPYFLHHASLYATATGRDAAASVVNLSDIFATYPNVTVEIDTMKSIDPARKLVVGTSKDYPYQTLILALGVVTTYFGINGMADHSYGIKTLNEVQAFKSHLHELVAADRHMDKNYVIIGGGLTGVELAGAMAGYLKEIAAAHQVKNAKISIVVVEAAPRILPRLSQTASDKVRSRLESLGVKILENHKVEALDDKTITVEGKKIPTETAIWTSGVANHPFFAQHPTIFELAKNGRVVVDNHLQATEHIHVIGDNASTPYTGTAWTALYDAKFIADHLARKVSKRPFKEYKPHKYSNSVPVGDGWAYVEKYGVYVSGKIGYMIRRFIELSGLKMLLPHDKAMHAWRAQHQHEETCDLCNPLR
jgi:NADH:quinone reductase (non-electrogenic)